VYLRVQVLNISSSNFDKFFFSGLWFFNFQSSFDFKKSIAIMIAFENRFRINQTLIEIISADPN